MGGAFGMYEGFKSSPSPALKVRVNTVLNSMTRRGPFIGNSAGVLALMYNGINGAIARGRGQYDPVNSVVAGAVTGAVFKSTGIFRDLVKPFVLLGQQVALLPHYLTHFYLFSFFSQ